MTASGAYTSFLPSFLPNRFAIHKKLDDLRLRKSLRVFREPIDFSVESCVPVPKPFHVTIEEKIQVLSFAQFWFISRVLTESLVLA